MERNRESRRTASTSPGGILSASRRPRAKDASDDEDGTDDVSESRAWERPRKDKPTAIHVSNPNLRNKRKRHGVSQEPHYASGRATLTTENAEESAEDAEMAASDDEDEEDEPPPPPPQAPLRRPVKSRSHAKEDEIVMDIPPVPRKARSSISSSSRFSLASRRQPEAVPTDIIRNKSPGQTQRSLNGSPTPTFLQKAGKNLKSAAPKFHPMKYPKVSEPTTISDQEAEVAEALYVLARSTPTSTGLLEPKIKARRDTDDQTSSPAVAIASTSVTNNSSQDVDSTLNGHVKDSNKPTAEAPKRKRPRVVCKPEEGKLCSPAQHSVASTVSSANPSTGKMELEPSLERSQIISTSAATVSSELLKSKDSSHSLERQLHNDEDIKIMHEGKDCSEPKIANKDGPESNTDVGDQQSSCSDVVPSKMKQRCSTASDVQVANNGDNKPELSDRPADVLDGISESSKLDIDLMRRAEDIPCTPLTRPLSDDGAHIHSTNKKLKVEEGELPKASSKEMANVALNERVKQDSAIRTINHEGVDLQNAHCIKESVEEESSKPYSKAQKNDADNIVSTTSAPMVSSAAANCSTAMAVGWIGGLPPIGYYGAGSIPWAAGAPMPNSNDVFNASHAAMQMPHAAILPPVARMKRCATHVYLAHLICRAQAQVSRQSLWSAALCRGPYNLNMPPVNIHDNDQLGTYVDIARKVSTQQPGPSYSFTVPQSSSPGMPGCSSANASISASNHSTNSGNIDSGDNTNVGHLMASTAPQLQYLQAVMQQNGFPSFPFRFTGPPGQAAQFFSNPFFPPHLLPPLPQLPPLGQQAATGLPMQKQQQGMSTAQQQSSSSQQTGPPRSPTHSQTQHGHVGVPITFGSHSERERTHGGEIVSKTENRLSPMQRNANDQGSSKLPNLNISPVLTTNIPVMHPHEQDTPVMATSGGKHHFRSQQQVSYENQAQTLPMHQQQYMQPNSGSVPGHQINSSSQGYPAIAISGGGRGTAGPLGLVSVSPMMAQGHGLLLASAENTRINIQQPKQSYESHNTQYQAATKKTNISNEDSYKIIGRDQSEDKKMPGKQTGSISQPSMIELEVSSPSVQVSATSGSTGWLNSNMGRSPTSTILPDTQGSKQTSSGMFGQHNSAINSQQTKQSTSRTKGSSVTNLNVYGYMDKGLHGNLGKIPGTMLPYTPQSVTSTQGSKQSQAGVMKNGQKMSPAPIQQATSTTSKSLGQQSRNSQQQAVLSTPLKMMPSAVPTATMPSGTLPMGSSHLLPASKSVVTTASKGQSNGKGVNSGNKSTSAAKKPSASSPSGTSAINSGQSMSAKVSTATIQQKGHAVHVTHFPQQQTLIPVQQSRMPNKAQLHSQTQSQSQQGQYKQSLQQLSPNRPQLFMQHQQYLQSPQSTSQPQLAVQHHYQQHSSLPSQHGQTQQLSQDAHPLHLPQHIQPMSFSQSTGLNNGLSLNSSSFTIGTVIPGNINGDTSLDGTDQFKGPTVRGHSSKAAYSSGGLPSTELITKLHPGVSGQVSPHDSSSQYMQATSVKSVDQKPSSDANREEIGSAATHVAVTSNPIS